MRMILVVRFFGLAASARQAERGGTGDGYDTAGHLIALPS